MANEGDSEEEQAKASPPEISEERDASTKRHSANVKIPEAETHPRKRGRPRKARLVVKRTVQILGRQASKRTLVANSADERPTQPSTSDAATSLLRPRGLISGPSRYIGQAGRRREPTPGQAKNRENFLYIYVFFFVNRT